MTPTEHFILRLQAYSWLLGYLKVEWEVEASACHLWKQLPV